jgi:hypothetical protein
MEAEKLIDRSKREEGALITASVSIGEEKGLKTWWMQEIDLRTVLGRTFRDLSHRVDV